MRFDKTFIAIAGVVIITAISLVPRGHAQESSPLLQPPAGTPPLTLTIQSDKKDYEAGENSVLTLEFKNVSGQNVWLFKNMVLKADIQMRLYRIEGEKKDMIVLPTLVDVLRSIPAERDFEELSPQEIFPLQITLKDFLGRQTLPKGRYEISVELSLPPYLFSKQLKITPWTGSVQSNTIKFDVKEKLSEDELRMKERLIALSQGEGSVADLRIELMDGGAMTTGKNGSYRIANGKIVSQEWDGIGSPMKRQERVVTDEEIRRLLRVLVEHQYWTFQGTQFIPDAPGFMFRFYYKDLPLDQYRCDAHEYEPSAQLSAIRSVWLSFVSGQSKDKKLPED